VFARAFAFDALALLFAGALPAGAIQAVRANPATTVKIKHFIVFIHCLLKKVFNVKHHPCTRSQKPLTTDL
jgi:hypothetical protein